jgi:hypothetical protein
MLDGLVQADVLVIDEQVNSHVSDFGGVSMRIGILQLPPQHCHSGCTAEPRCHSFIL